LLLTAKLRDVQEVPSMRYRSLALAATVALALAVPARAATPTKPLRTLVYAVQYSAQSRNDEQTSGFTGNGGGPGTAGGLVTRTTDAGDDGTLTVNVIAATPDGGLVVDASFVGKTTTQPALRVAIFPDGRLSLDPSAVLSPEAVEVLPLLARGLVAGRDVSVGSSWTIDDAPPLKGSHSYKVTALDVDVATLAIAGTRNLSGARGYDQSDTGTAQYDTVHLCPLSYDLTSNQHHTVGTSQFVSTNARLTAKLVSDSFAH
jgi:hypothetical protein